MPVGRLRAARLLRFGRKESLNESAGENASGSSLRSRDEVHNEYCARNRQLGHAMNEIGSPNNTISYVETCIQVNKMGLLEAKEEK